MTIWCLQFSKKTTQKFDEFLSSLNLKRGQIRKIMAPFHTNMFNNPELVCSKGLFFPI